MIDVSSVPPCTPMPSSLGRRRAALVRAARPGWARNVISPWSSRSSRLATLSSALLPPWPLRNTSRLAGVVATHRPMSSSTASSVVAREPDRARRPGVLVATWCTPASAAATRRAPRPPRPPRPRPRRGDDGVGAERQVRAVLLDGTERLHEDAALGEPFADLRAGEVGEVALARCHVRTLPAAPVGQNDG